MKRFLSLLIVLFLLTGCGASDGGKSDSGNEKISFEAYIREGETFEFSFDPEDAVTYEKLRNSEFRDSLSVSNWKDYFNVVETYREHYEYDEEGRQTGTYMRGSFYTIELLDQYYYVDNWTRNALEYEVYVDGQESRVMTNNGKVYDPVVEVYQEVRDYSGADPMLILTDFENVWDEETIEKYTGQLNSYEMISASGDLYLLNASAIEFKKYKNNIYCFVAYDSPEEYYVILIKTDDKTIDREKEYEGAVYCTSGSRVNERYTGFVRIVPWQMIVDLMKKVNDQ